jgi:tetratricopeptide (TPR) repeat protein
MLSNNLSGYKASCFVVMPFHKTVHLARGIEIDFDQIYESAIKPAIIDSGLEPLRADEEQLGGIIHSAMFARLLLSEYVVADLTAANPNVYYELGIRHAVKPYTTILIRATLDRLPFDVGMVRAVSYNIEKKGQITQEGSEELKKELEERLRQTLKARLEEAIIGQAQADSPVFELITHYPGIHLPADVKVELGIRIKDDDQFKEKLEGARAEKTNEERTRALLKIQNDLGDLKTVQSNILIRLLLTFRSVEAWDEIVRLCESLSEPLKMTLIVNHEWAYALNCRNNVGDRNKALSLLEKILKDHGPDAETLGLIGSVYKHLYDETREQGMPEAPAFLDKAIDVYRDGFKLDPRDYYPGVNAINLLIEKGCDASLAESKELNPLVRFAIERRGGISSSNYWDLAAVLEFACINEEWDKAKDVLSKVLVAATESWKPTATINNLNMLKARLSKQQAVSPHLDEIMEQIRKRKSELEGSV